MYIANRFMLCVWKITVRLFVDCESTCALLQVVYFFFKKKQRRSVYVKNNPENKIIQGWIYSVHFLIRTAHIAFLQNTYSYENGSSKVDSGETWTDTFLPPHFLSFLLFIIYVIFIIISQVLLNILHVKKNI